MIIELQNIIPSPLQELTTKESQVWRRNVLFEQGQHYVISAESGKGKTTLLSILFGLRTDYSGEVNMDNQNIFSFGHSQWVNFRRHKLALVPQGLCLFNHLSGIENIRIKNRLTRHLSESKIQAYLKLCGMADHQHKPAGILSYGQKQRIAIIRALCQPFDFILMDEAYSHLDQQNAEIASGMVNTEAEKQRAGIILTSLTPRTEGFENTLKL